MNNPFDPGYFTEEDLILMGFKEIGTNVKIAKSCTIIGLTNIFIGNNVRVDGYCSIIAGENEPLKIGSHVHIAGYCGLYGGSGIVLGDFAGLSQGVRIFTGTDDYSGNHLTNPTVSEQFTNVHRGKVLLERHVIIGTGSVILPNVTIHEGVAVGAMSLVNKSLDSWNIYAGCPAKVIKKRSKNLLKLEEALLRAK